MSNEGEVFISDVLKHAADNADSLKVFENVLLSHNLIKENYKNYATLFSFYFYSNKE